MIISISVPAGHGGGVQGEIYDGIIRRLFGYGRSRWLDTPTNGTTVLKGIELNSVFRKWKTFVIILLVYIHNLRLFFFKAVNAIVSLT